MLPHHRRARHTAHSSSEGRGMRPAWSGVSLLLAVLFVLTLTLQPAYQPPVAHAADQTVCASGCDATSIQAAIDSATAGDTIYIGPGTYNENLTISKDINLVGAGASEVTIQGVDATSGYYVDADLADRGVDDKKPSVVTVESNVTEAWISGVTITGGGGNIYIDPDPISQGNDNPDGPGGPYDDDGRRVGGGIENLGTLTLSHSVVTGNTITGDKGLDGRPPPEAEGVAYGGRWSPLGGGIYNAGTMTIGHSTISDNSVIGGDGTGYNTVTTNEAFSSGAGAGIGGGIFNDGDSASLTIYNSTISGNSATGGSSRDGGSGAGIGAGIYSEGDLEIVNSTIAENIARGGSGRGLDFGASADEFGGGGGFGGDGGNPEEPEQASGGFGGGGGFGPAIDELMPEPWGGGIGGFGGGGAATTTINDEGAPGGFGGGGGGGFEDEENNPPDGDGPGTAGGAGGFGAGDGGRGAWDTYGGGGGGAAIGGGVFINADPARTNQATLPTVQIESTTIVSNTALGGNGGTGARLILGETFAVEGEGGGGFGGGLFSNGVSVTVYNSVLADNAVESGESGDDSDPDGALEAQNPPPPAPVDSEGPNCWVNTGGAGDYAQVGEATAGSFLNNDLSRLSVTDVQGDACNVTGFILATVDMPDLADNGGPTLTVEPAAGSIVNAGNSPEATDQRDLPRPQGSQDDRGSVEVLPVTAIAAAPTLNLPNGLQSYGTGDGDLVLEPAATLADDDSVDFATLEISTTTFLDMGNETLSLPQEGVADGQITWKVFDAGAYIYYEGVVVGEVTTLADDNIVIDFNANDTVDAVRAIIRKATYSNAAAAPSVGERDIDFIVEDADGGSVSATTTVRTGPMITVASGAETYQNGDDVEVDPTDISTPVTRTLTITNTGTTSMTLGVPQLATGTVFSLPDGDFVGTNPVPAGESVTLDIELLSASAGAYTDVLSFTHNALNTTSPYTVTLLGSVAEPEIQVGDGQVNIRVDDTVDFGTVFVNTPPVSTTFTVTNTGFSDLTVSNLSLANGTDFSIASDLGANTLANGETTTFAIELATGTTGVFSDTVSIDTNDPDEDPFTFIIEGTVESYEIYLPVIRNPSS